MKYIEKEILRELIKKLKLKDKIVVFIFRKYTYRIYEKGFKDGFNLSVSYTDESN